MSIITPIVLFLILFPLLVMLLMMTVNNRRVRGLIIKAASLLIAAGSIWLTVACLKLGEPVKLTIGSEAVTMGMQVVSLLIALYVILTGIKDRKPLAVGIAAVQFLLIVGAEFLPKTGPEVQYSLMVDNLTLIMVLLIGIIGSLICIFAVGYMEKYHHHKQMKDQSKLFFSVIFAFLSAVFGLVMSNDLTWLLFFWEITTFCSYLLIGYTKKPDAVSNAYRALVMNMAGGILFLLGIEWLRHIHGIVQLDQLIAARPEAVLAPVVLLSFAGIVKSAQMPFSSWLLGAMVAPTPTSALLHSSTMVKAGVYIIIRLSPVFKDTTAGQMIALVGAVTFLLSSLIAISKHNVKKLLAYSTVSTLGLIVACAGVGTYQAVWTAVLLMIFHAVAKSLLFLCVGTVEQGIESLNIEDMDGLILRMPRVTVCLLIGIAGMFIAPFGMLISKWAALEALVKANPLIAFIVVFGSSATLFFYTKWMGKLIMIMAPTKPQEGHVSGDEWFTMGALSFMTVGVCVAFPLISSGLIDPFIRLVYQHSASMEKGNVIIMLIMMTLILLLPLQILLQHKDDKSVTAYLCGGNITDGKKPHEANSHFHTAGRDVAELTLRNYYFEDYFGEARLGRIGLLVTCLLLAVMFGVVLI